MPIVQQLEKMEQISPKGFKRSDEVRHFVLISTLMTWASTKPLSPDEPELPFTEEDYRKRKPHPNFKRHVQCEKDVVTAKRKIKLRDKLKTLVICCGATYGDEQGPLHHLFKMAWQNAPFLPIIGKGNNNIPLLHVRDLSNVVLDVLQNWPPLRYIVAVEQEPTSQSTIVKGISRALTTGKVKKIEQEEAFLLPDVTQRTYDLTTMNLIIDPVYIADRISWHFDSPFPDNIDAIVKEYKTARNLNPVKITVLGPPASGKTRVARYLADHYDIHYVHVKSLIADTIDSLSKEIEEAATSPVEQDGAEQTLEDEEDVEKDRVEEMQELLDEIERNMQRTNGRLDDALLNKLAKQLDKTLSIQISATSRGERVVRVRVTVEFQRYGVASVIDVHCARNVSIVRTCHRVLANNTLNELDVKPSTDPIGRVHLVKPPLFAAIVLPHVIRFIDLG
ncbi:hypothetical protein K0M31_010089 [Melipona bicolor]|uniref:Uncharacterized protein n=1 Tax=Melipona bicolor TaxID=60889 RepID=A0AA40FM98_9HYME|nr:hypothetical protein K0M31_010089 [Melipona bicolor]